MRAVAARETPLDRPAVEAAGEAVDLEQRRSLGDPQRFGIERIGGDGSQLLFGADDRDPEALLIEDIELVRQVAPERQFEPRKECRRQRDPLEDDRLAAQGTQPPHRPDGAARRQVEAPRLRPLGLALAELQHAPGRQLLDAALVANVEEVEERVLLAVAGDEGAEPLPAHDEILRRHLVERLAHGALADAELGGEPPLARQDVAGAPVAAQHAADDELAHLRVERPEIRAGNGAAVVHPRSLGWQLRSVRPILLYKIYFH